MKNVFLILIVSVTCTFANIGKITAVKGKVYIVRDAQQITAKSGSVLELKDHVQTKAKAKALVLFNDNTSITVGNNSSLSVNEFVMDLKTPSKSKTNFGFGKGVFRTITGRIGKLNPKGFIIKTKSASIGIRGTIFKVEITPKDLVMDVQSGATWILPNNQTIPINVPEGSVLVFDDESGSLEVMPKETFEKKKKEEKEKKNKDSKAIDETKNTQSDEESTSSTEIGKIINTIKKVTDDVKKKIDDEEQESNNSSDETDEKDDEESTSNSKEGDSIEESEEEVNIPEEGQEGGGEIIIDEGQGGEEVIPEITYQSMCPNNGESCDHYANVDFGYLFEDGILAGVYVGEKIVTATSVIDNYINNYATASYTGSIAAIINGTTQSGGIINLNMDFQYGNLTGNITVTEENWKAQINSGTIGNASFSSDDISSAVGSSVSGIEGNLNGHYYGPNGNSVGGLFDLNSGVNSIIGSFGAHDSSINVP